MIDCLLYVLFVFGSLIVISYWCWDRMEEREENEIIWHAPPAPWKDWPYDNAIVKARWKEEEER